MAISKSKNKKNLAKRKARIIKERKNKIGEASKRIIYVSDEYERLVNEYLNKAK